MPRRQHGTDVVWGQAHRVGQRAGALQHVAQLAHVAGPVVARQQRDGGGVDFAHRRSGAGGQFLEQVLRQLVQIRQALAQRRQPDRKHAQAAVQIRSETPMGDQLLEVDGAGGDQPQVDLDEAVRSQRLDLLVLQHAQQLRLQRQRQIADFVQEQRPAVGQFELAVACVSIGAGERAGRDPEKLGLEQRIGHRGQGNADERTVGARRGGVDCVRQHLLAGTGLAQQHDRAVLLRGAAGLSLHIQSRCAAADETGERDRRAPMLGQPAPRLGQVGLQLREFRNERLQRAQLVIQHQSNGADHLSLLVLQRHPRDDQRLTAQLHHVQQDRLAAAHDLAHQAVRDDLLDLAAQRVAHALQPERGQVFFVDPGDPGLPVHRHRALAQAVESLEQRLHRQPVDRHRIAQDFVRQQSGHPGLSNRFVIGRS
jgi:hypothetical protein